VPPTTTAAAGLSTVAAPFIVSVPFTLKLAAADTAAAVLEILKLP
jgi:hypothetical protein